MMQNCPACGRPVEEGAGFCPHCDATLYGIQKAKKKKVAKTGTVQKKQPKTKWEEAKEKAVRFLFMRDSKIFATGKTPPVLRLVQGVVAAPLVLIAALVVYWIYITTVYIHLEVYVFDIFNLARWNDIGRAGVLRNLFLVLFFLLMALALQIWLLISTVYRQKIVRNLCIASVCTFLVLLVAAAIVSAPIWVQLLLALGLLCPLAVCLWLWKVPRAQKVFSLQPFKQKQYKPSPNRVRKTAAVTAMCCGLVVLLSVFGGVLTEIYVSGHAEVVPGASLVWPSNTSVEGPVASEPLAQGTPYSTYVPTGALLPAAANQWGGGGQQAENAARTYTVTQGEKGALIAFSDGEYYSMEGATVVHHQASSNGNDVYVLLYNGAQYTELYRLHKGQSPQRIAVHAGQMKLSVDGSALYYTEYDPEQGSVWMSLYSPEVGVTRRVIDIAFLGIDVGITQEEGWPALYDEAGSFAQDFAVSPNGEYALFNSSYGLLLYQRTDMAVRHLGDAQQPAAVSNNGRMVAWYNESRKAFTLVLYGEEKQQLEIAADLTERPGPAFYTNADATQFLVCGDQGIFLYKNTMLTLYAEVGPVGLITGDYMSQRQTVLPNQNSENPEELWPLVVHTGAQNIQSIFYTTGGATGYAAGNANFEDGLYWIGPEMQTPKQLAQGAGTATVNTDATTVTLLENEGGVLARLTLSEEGSVSRKVLAEDVGFFAASKSGFTTYCFVPEGGTYSEQGDVQPLYTLYQFNSRAQRKEIASNCAVTGPGDFQVDPNGEGCMYFTYDDEKGLEYRYWASGGGSGVLFEAVPATQNVDAKNVRYSENGSVTAFFVVNFGDEEKQLYFFSGESAVKVADL